MQRALPRLEGTYGLARRQPAVPRPGRRRPARQPARGRRSATASTCWPATRSRSCPHTARVAYLQDGEVVRLTPDDFEIRHRERGSITPRIDRIDWKPDAVELGGHAHYMLKEIREQPDTVHDACRGRLRRAEATAQFGGLNLTARQLRRVRRIVFAACGTSWHAALVGEYLIERLAHLPVEVEYASEFRYRNAPLDDRTLVFVLSQSGETADTLGALREAKRQGHPDAGDRQHRRQHDRPRGRRRHLPPRRPRGRRRQHQGVLGAGHGADPAGALPRPAPPPLVHRRPGRRRRDRGRPRGARPRAGDRAPDRRRPPSGSPRPRSALYLGRDLHYPVALEGALKLKEISYIHAEGYPTAEMKHGPIALIDRETPCVFVAPRGSLHAKTLSNVEEVRARHGPIIAVGTEGDDVLAALSDVFLPIPDVPEVVQPLAGGRPAPAPRLPRRPPPRLRHRQAAEPRQERDGRMSTGLGSLPKTSNSIPPRIPRGGIADTRNRRPPVIRYLMRQRRITAPPASPPPSE